MHRTKVTFERKGTFKMKGGAEVNLDNPNDYGELYRKGSREEFLSYLPFEIEYDTDEWDFSFLPEEERAVAND